MYIVILWELFIMSNTKSFLLEYIQNELKPQIEKEISQILKENERGSDRRKMLRAGAITKSIIKKSPWKSNIDLAYIQYILRGYFPQNSNTFKNSLQSDERPSRVGDGKWGRETYNAILDFQKDIKTLIGQGKLNDLNLKLPSGKKLDKFQADGIYGLDTHAAHRVTIFVGLRKSGDRVNLSAKPQNPKITFTGPAGLPTVTRDGEREPKDKEYSPLSPEDLEKYSQMSKRLKDIPEEAETAALQHWAAGYRRGGAEARAKIIKYAKFWVSNIINDPKYDLTNEDPNVLFISLKKLLKDVDDNLNDEGFPFLKGVDMISRQVRDNQIQRRKNRRQNESTAHNYIEKIINEELDKILG